MQGSRANFAYRNVSERCSRSRRPSPNYFGLMRVHASRVPLQELSEVGRQLSRTTNDMYETVADALLDKVRILLLHQQLCFIVVTCHDLLRPQDARLSSVVCNVSQVKQR